MSAKETTLHPSHGLQNRALAYTVSNKRPQYLTIGKTNETRKPTV